MADVDEPDEIARDAGAMLRRMLDAVERGHLTAGTPQATALIRLIEGASSRKLASVRSSPASRTKDRPGEIPEH